MREGRLVSRERHRRGRRERVPRDAAQAVRRREHRQARAARRLRLTRAAPGLEPDSLWLARSGWSRARSRRPRDDARAAADAQGARRAPHTCARNGLRDCEEEMAPADRRRAAAAAEDLARVGGHDAKVEIVEYDPAWPATYQPSVSGLRHCFPPGAAAPLRVHRRAGPGGQAGDRHDRARGRPRCPDRGADASAAATSARRRSTPCSLTGGFCVTRRPPIAPIICTS